MNYKEALLSNMAPRQSEDKESIDWKEEEED